MSLGQNSLGLKYQEPLYILLLNTIQDQKQKEKTSSFTLYLHVLKSSSEYRP